MTYREIIFMVLDQTRLITDDITLNEEHALFLINKYRALLLTQKYKSVKTEVAEANYQTLCLTLEESSPLNGARCDGEDYLRSSYALPNRLNIGNDIVATYDYYQGLNISLVPRERMRYAGSNKFMRNIIYCSIGPDGHLYFKSRNPQFRYLSQVKFVGVFEDPDKASELACDEECNLYDRVYPIEDALVSALVEAVVKELSGPAYQPHDQRNNANDDNSKVVTRK